MLASRPSPEAGQRLKAARIRARLSTRDVERLSHDIASEQDNPDCCISHSWLTQVENSEFVPGTFKLYTLCRLYNLKPEEILAFYGLGLRERDQSYMSLKLPNTHLLGPLPEDPGQIAPVPRGLIDPQRLSETNLVSRMFESWREIPVSLLQQIDLRNSVLGYIGLKDFTMYPLLRPGSLVQVDSRSGRYKLVAGQTSMRGQSTLWKCATAVFVVGAISTEANSFSCQVRFQAGRYAPCVTRTTPKSLAVLPEL